MRPLPFSQFRSDAIIAWPRWMRFEPDVRKTSVGFVLLALIFVCLTLLLSAVAEAATFSGAGQTCPLQRAYELRQGPPVVADACGTAWTCAPAGGSYSAAAVLTLTGCRDDRVFAGQFESPSLVATHGYGPWAVADVPYTAARYVDERRAAVSIGAPL